MHTALRRRRPARDAIRPGAPLTSRAGGPGVRSRARYRFDRALSRGPLVVIGYLAVVMAAIVVAAALVLTLLRLTGVNGGPRLGFGEALWQSLLRVVDSGTIASDAHWSTRLVSLVVTLCGIVIAGSLIGLIANGVDQHVAQLRKGRSAVLEHGHTVVLGWSPRLPSILAEIALANENHRGRAFVVLADRAKDEMEDELRRAVPDTRGTRVVCRTGDVGDVRDLALVNAAGARSVIVLSGEGGDAAVVRTVLAVRTLDPEFEQLRVVAELSDAETVASLRELSHHRLAAVRADDVIAQVTAQACHQGGLAAVFRDLLDFDGDEIYFTAVPELAGHRYDEAVLAFEHASVIGVARAGRVVLNPRADALLAMGDEVIAIAEDDDRVVFDGLRRDVAPDAAARATPVTEPAQRVVLVGWSRLGAEVLAELDRFLAPGSVVDVMVDATLLPPEQVLVPPSGRCRVAVHGVAGGPQALVHALGPRHYDQAIVLGYREQLPTGEADARSLLTLVALQRAWKHAAQRPRVVAEMLDRANVAIASATGVDDFIVSDELSSLMIAQLSERLDLQDVFAELFDAEGCALSLLPAVCFTTGGETTVAHLVATAAARGMSAVGYRRGDAPAVLNPPKSERVTLGPSDQVLVVARRPTTPRPSPTGPTTGGSDVQPDGAGSEPVPVGPSVADPPLRHVRITDAPRRPPVGARTPADDDRGRHRTS